jgi:ACS family tartrate transporter-like MFS transporter
MGGMTNPPTVADRLIAFFWRSPAPTIAERTRRRVTIHLIPFLFFLYVLAYLDRVNVSVAQFGMKEPRGDGGLGLGLDVIGFGAGLFFWGYWILEIPSTVSVVRLGARWVFARVLVLWGICAALAGSIDTPVTAWLFGWLPQLTGGGPVVDFINGLRDTPRNQFYFLRFMLGFFEGGFFPSVIVYLSLWFRPADRAKAVAGFMAAIPISSMLGSPISGLLLGVKWFGLPGWRWIFILEGIAPVLAGIATLFFLPDSPAVAKWLRPEEREWLAGELAAEDAAKKGHGHWEWVHQLGLVLLLTFVYFGQNVISYGISMFMPMIIQSQTGYSEQASTYLCSPAYMLALVMMLLNGRHSDRTGERYWHTAVPMALLGLGVLTAGLTNGLAVIPAVVVIFWVGPMMYAHLPAFWPIPTSVLGATTAAAAIGFINMIGNLGGSVGPWMVGEQKHDVRRALLLLAPWPIASAVVVLGLGYMRAKRKQSQGG